MPTAPAPRLTLPARYLLPALARARALGVDEARLQAACEGVAPAVLAMPGGRVPLVPFSRAAARLAALMQDEGLGLLPRRVPPGTLELLVRACATARDLTACVGVVSRFLAVTGLPLRLSVDDGPDALRLTLSPPDDGTVSGLPGEVVAATLLALSSWLVGQRVPLVAVSLPGRAPVAVARRELDGLFGCPIRWGRPAVTLKIGADSAQLPVVRGPAQIERFVSRAPASVFEALYPSGPLSVRLRRLMQSRLQALPDAAEAARALALSPRTLHRRLAREGTSLQGLKDALRRDAAIHALAWGRRPLKRIAEDLGFADQAAFHRAFVHWTGQTPGAWRRGAQADQALAAPSM